MSKAARLSLPYARWPAGDRRAWQAAFTRGDIFDDSGQGLRLSDSSRRNYEVGYARWLGFLSRSDPAALSMTPPARVTQARITAFTHPEPPDRYHGRCCRRRSSQPRPPWSS